LILAYQYPQQRRFAGAIVPYQPNAFIGMNVPGSIVNNNPCTKFESKIIEPRQHAAKVRDG
jgi:hypothetical protein